MIEGCRRTAALGVDALEFDVSELSDKTLVLPHDQEVVDRSGQRRKLSSLTRAHVVSGEVALPLLEDLMPTFRDHPDVIAHIDFKFEPMSDHYIVSRDSNGMSLPEYRALDMIAEFVAPQNMLVTTMEEESLRQSVVWAEAHGMTIGAGLSLGTLDRGSSWIERKASLAFDARPLRRLRYCNANWIVSEQSLAKRRLSALAAQRGYDLLVWTPRDADSIDYWTQPDNGAKMVASDLVPELLDAARRNHR